MKGGLLWATFFCGLLLYYYEVGDWEPSQDSGAPELCCSSLSGT